MYYLFRFILPCKLNVLLYINEYLTSKFFLHLNIIKIH